MQYLNSGDLATRYRGQAINLATRQVLVTNFRGTDQEKDLSERANCGGFGRVRHFVRTRSDNWVDNPLPIDPAIKALGLSHGKEVRAQVFQNAVCNWRCWYCFVPFTLLEPNKAHSKMLTAGELIDFWLQEPNRPPMIDLTGGQPELVPEWVLWMMQELRARNLQDEVYLWSDDNLSSDYFWSSLTDGDRAFIASYPKYGRVCCFKGFDAESFSFNTMAPPDEYELQFKRMGKLLDIGLDLYCYATFTSPLSHDLMGQMSGFVDRLQELDENLPLRTIPLKIDVFTPTASRLNDERNLSLKNQFRALDAWQKILDQRYSSSLRALPICDVSLAKGVSHAR